MTFQEPFLPYVCTGDTIICDVDGFTVTAQVRADDCPDTPAQRQDGFWPSLDVGDPGFIGPGANHRDRLNAARASAESVMEAWRKGDWFYCGIVLAVSLEGVILSGHAASLWGIEANYPDSDNVHLTDVANSLLPGALDEARKVLARLRAAPTVYGVRT